MKKEFKKNSAKKKSLTKTLIIAVLIIILLIGIILLTISLKNIIEVSKVNDDAKLVSDDAASKATPILVNNLLLGAVYDKTWVSSEKFYFHGNTSNDTSVDVYTENGKKGTYTLETMTKSTNGSAVYISTSNTNKNDEYVAVVSSEHDIMPNPASEYVNISEADYTSVKEALGGYKILNSSINITKAYDITLDTNTKGRIYIVNNVAGKGMGGYSAVIYKDMSGKTSIVKYSFVANLKNSSEWPIYSFKFVADLNNDGKNEIIIQETREFDAKYDVIEYTDNKFVEVLSSEMKI